MYFDCLRFSSGSISCKYQNRFCRMCWCKIVERTRTRREINSSTGTMAMANSTAKRPQIFKQWHIFIALSSSTVCPCMLLNEWITMKAYCCLIFRICVRWKDRSNWIDSRNNSIFCLFRNEKTPQLDSIWKTIYTEFRTHDLAVNKGASKIEY